MDSEKRCVEKIVKVVEVAKVEARVAECGADEVRPLYRE
jgi:hypothetical protein